MKNVDWEYLITTQFTLKIKFINSNQFHKLKKFKGKSYLQNCLSFFLNRSFIKRKKKLRRKRIELIDHKICIT